MSRRVTQSHLCPPLQPSCLVTQLDGHLNQRLHLHWLRLALREAFASKFVSQASRLYCPCPPSPVRYQQRAEWVCTLTRVLLIIRCRHKAAYNLFRPRAGARSAGPASSPSTSSPAHRRGYSQPRLNLLRIYVSFSETVMSCDRASEVKCDLVLSQYSNSKRRSTHERRPSNFLNPEPWLRSFTPPGTASKGLVDSGGKR